MLRQFERLSAEFASTTLENLTSIILGLGMYFFPVHAMPKQKRAMRRGTREPHGFEVRFYTDCLIDIEDYLAVLPGVQESDFFV